MWCFVQLEHFCSLPSGAQPTESGRGTQPRSLRLALPSCWWLAYQESLLPLSWHKSLRLNVQEWGGTVRSESLVSHCRNFGFYSECGVVRTKRGWGGGEEWRAERGPLYLSQAYVLHLPCLCPCPALASTFSAGGERNQKLSFSLSTMTSTKSLILY